MGANSSCQLLHVEQRDGEIFVSLSKRRVLEEAAAQEMGRRLAELADEAKSGRLILDLAQLEYLSSLGLAKLISVHKRLSSAGGRLVLCNIREPIMEVFTQAHLHKIFFIDSDPLGASASQHEFSSSNAVLPGPHWENTEDVPLIAGGENKAAQPVVLFEPDVEQASVLLRKMSNALQLIHLTEWTALEELCLHQEPVAIAMPLGHLQPGTDAPLLRFIRTYGRQIPIVVYGHTEPLSVTECCRPLAAGAHRLINSALAGFSQELADCLQRLLHDRSQAGAEREQLSKEFAQHGLVGNSHALREVFRRALRAAHFSDLPILIIGETGTGKQRLAEAIHRLDPRRQDKPFVSINCSAIHKSLAESELFGHARGAYSGAAGERKGVFRAADGGTLLLDELGELDPELQPKLLRVLQEKRLLPVGEDYEHPIDVRIIAATNRPLERMVAEGRFRPDLFQRLNVYRIEIPPLRARREDIEDQARYFLSLCQPGSNPHVMEFGPRVLEALTYLPWEGNSRQLENLIREMLVHKVRDRSLQMEDLPEWVLDTLLHESAPDAPTDAAHHTLPPGTSLSAALEAYERRLLESALRQNGGNRTRTAAMLGLTPRSIFNKIKKYRLDA